MAKALDLRPDGTFIVRDGAREWRARRPTIGEWRSIVEAVEAVDRTAQAVEDMEAGAEKDLARTEFRKQGGYGPAMASALTLLAGFDGDAMTLPAWCTEARPIVEVMAHWRTVPLDLSVDEESATSMDATAPEPSPSQAA